MAYLLGKKSIVNVNVNVLRCDVDGKLWIFYIASNERLANVASWFYVIANVNLSILVWLESLVGIYRRAYITYPHKKKTVVANADQPFVAVATSEAAEPRALHVILVKETVLYCFCVLCVL